MRRLTSCPLGIGLESKRELLLSSESLPVEMNTCKTAGAPSGVRVLKVKALGVKEGSKAPFIFVRSKILIVKLIALDAIHCFTAVGKDGLLPVTVISDASKAPLARFRITLFLVELLTTEPLLFITPDNLSSGTVPFRYSVDLGADNATVLRRWCDPHHCTITYQYTCQI